MVGYTSSQEQLEADVHRTWDTSVRRRTHPRHMRTRGLVSH